MTEEQIADYKEKGFHYVKEVPGRGVCGLYEFLFTIAIVSHIQPDGDYYMWRGGWCYPKENVMEALVALHTWDGEEDPEGCWVKYKGEGGEYRNPALGPEPHEQV